MNNIYKDDIFKFNQYTLNPEEDIFKKILEIRKNEIDSKRFFLKYIPNNELNKYNFNDLNSLENFRNDCFKWNSPLKNMGGCNLIDEEIKKGIRYAGIKLSDPYGKIIGVFNISNNVILYSPIFPLFYEERDLIKFAEETYFTPISFEELIINQINSAHDYYVHIGNYSNVKDIIKYGSYIWKKVNKDQMIDYATNPNSGEKILKKHLNIN